MAALNLCQFKNGTANATSSPPATQQNVRPSGGGRAERLAIASALRDPRRGSPRPALDSLLRGPPGHQRGQPDRHLRAAARSASAARSADQGTRPRDVPDLGAPAGPRPSRAGEPAMRPRLGTDIISATCTSRPEKEAPDEADPPHQAPPRPGQRAAIAAASRPARPGHRARPSGRPPHQPLPRPPCAAGPAHPARADARKPVTRHARQLPGPADQAGAGNRRTAALPATAARSYGSPTCRTT